MEEAKVLWGEQGPLQTIYDIVVAYAVCYAAMCHGSEVRDRGRRKLDKLVRTASSVLDCQLDSIQEVANRRMLAKLTFIMGKTSPASPKRKDSFVWFHLESDELVE